MTDLTPFEQIGALLRDAARVVICMFLTAVFTVTALALAISMSTEKFP